MRYTINRHHTKKGKRSPAIDKCPVEGCHGTLESPKDDTDSFSVFGFNQDAGEMWFELECSKCGVSVTHFGEYTYSEAETD